jgi:putative transcriptional regulator
MADMQETHTQLSAPLLLLSTPQVMDPYFHRSVVLLISHEEKGSAGFIVNRTTHSRVEEMLRNMGITWGGKADATVYFGGPVQPHLGTVMFDGKEIPLPLAEGESEPPASFQGVRLSRDVTSLARISERPPPSFRLLLGYAGWGEGQLVEEILRNDWLIAPLSKDLIFSAAPEQVWETAIRGIGLDPGSLPAWVSGSGEGPVN